MSSTFRSVRTDVTVAAAIAVFAIVAAVIATMLPRRARSGVIEKQQLVYAGPGSPEEVAIIKPILEQFEQDNPRYHVRFIHIPGDGYWTKIKTMFAGRVPPDVMYMGGGYVQELAAAGLLVDIREKVSTPGAELNLADFPRAALDAYEFNGGLYGIPRDVAPIAVYYNKDVFDAAGLRYPDRDWTRDDYVAIAQQLTRPQIHQFGCQIRLWQGDYVSVLWQSGARILDPMKTRVMIESPEAVDAFTYLQDLLHKQHVAPTAQQEGRVPLFNAGRVGMICGGYWEAANFRTLKFRWGAVRPPKSQRTGVHGSELVGTAYSIASASRCPDGAWKLAVYMTSAAVQRSVAVQGLAVPARTSALTDEDLSKDPILAAFVDALHDARPPPYLPRWREMEAVLDQHFQRLMLNIQTPQATAAAMQKDLTPLVAPEAQ